MIYYTSAYVCNKAVCQLSNCLGFVAELLANCGEAGVPDLVSVLRSIATENIPNLPPGGGLPSK